MEVVRASDSNGLVSGRAVEEDGGRGRPSRMGGGGNGGIASRGRMRKKKRSRSLGRKFSGEEEIEKMGMYKNIFQSTEMDTQVNFSFTGCKWTPRTRGQEMGKKKVNAMSMGRRWR